MAEHYQLKCRECGKLWGNPPRSFARSACRPRSHIRSDAIRPIFTRKNIEAGPNNLWRYRALCPSAKATKATLPTGFTPLVQARRLGKKMGASNLYMKNDAVCIPTLWFKDRVVAVALAEARRSGFQVVVLLDRESGERGRGAGRARRLKLIFVPADLEPAKILSTQVYGAKLVRIAATTTR